MSKWWNYFFDHNQVVELFFRLHTGGGIIFSATHGWWNYLNAHELMVELFERTRANGGII